MDNLKNISQQGERHTTYSAVHNIVRLTKIGKGSVSTVVELDEIYTICGR